MLRSILTTCLCLLLCQMMAAQASQAHRVIVLTDIEADPDDTQSLVRLLLYANQIDIKAIVATTSCWKRTNVEPASIIKELEADDDRPLWISTWGGVNTSLWRWREEFQQDFAARMYWCTQSYGEANHPPVPVLGHPEQITVKAGQGFELDASGSTDPDGDNLTFLWSHYPEAGSYQGTVSLGAENVHGVYVTAPEVSKQETIHFILQLTDKGTPAITRYKRVVMTVVPE